MTRWEYCQVHWLLDEYEEFTVTEFSIDGEHRVTSFEPDELGTILAQLGAEGWELTNCMASPKGIHEYWYYFKRWAEVIP